jgi:copper chaperone CopZ
MPGHREGDKVPPNHHHDDSRRPAVDGENQGPGAFAQELWWSVNPATGAIRRLVDTDEGAVMMSNTPRVFVGTTTFLIAGITSGTDLQTVTAAINGFPGVRVTGADLLTGVVTVTVDRPANRADLAAAIDHAGYTVLA